MLGKALNLSFPLWLVCVCLPSGDAHFRELYMCMTYLHQFWFITHPLLSLPPPASPSPKRYCFLESFFYVSHIRPTTWCLTFYIWLILLSIMVQVLSSFLHMSWFHFSFWLDNITWCIHTTFSLQFFKNVYMKTLRSMNSKEHFNYSIW